MLYKNLRVFKTDNDFWFQWSRDVTALWLGLFSWGNSVWASTGSTRNECRPLHEQFTTVRCTLPWEVRFPRFLAVPGWHSHSERRTFVVHRRRETLEHAFLKAERTALLKNCSCSGWSSLREPPFDAQFVLPQEINARQIGVTSLYHAWLSPFQLFFLHDIVFALLLYFRTFQACAIVSCSAVVVSPYHRQPFREHSAVL